MTPEHDLIPNFTQFPNKLMDYVIPLLRESEEKVLIYVLRCTYGYRDQDGKQKEQDYISYSQFIAGQMSKEGKLLNFGAGVSRSKLAEALAFHQATGLIERLDPAAGKRNAGRGATGLYRLNRHCEMVHFLNQCLPDPDTARERMVHFLNQKRLMVQKVNHSNKKAKKDKPQAKNGSESEPLKNGSESEPEMVQKVNQQYKEKESKDTPLPPKRAKGYADYPGFCQLWEMAVIRPTGSKGNKQESLQAWKIHGLETNPSLAEEVLRAYAYQKTTAKWHENGGEYVPELQRWLKPKRWEGVTVPEGFDRNRPWQPTQRSYEPHPGGGIKSDSF